MQKEEFDRKKIEKVIKSTCRRWKERQRWLWFISSQSNSWRRPKPSTWGCHRDMKWSQNWLDHQEKIEHKSRPAFDRSEAEILLRSTVSSRSSSSSYLLDVCLQALQPVINRIYHQWPPIRPEQGDRRRWICFFPTKKVNNQNSNTTVREWPCFAQKGRSSVWQAMLAVVQVIFLHVCVCVWVLMKEWCVCVQTDFSKIRKLNQMKRKAVLRINTHTQFHSDSSQHSTTLWPSWWTRTEPTDKRIWKHTCQKMVF